MVSFLFSFCLVISLIYAHFFSQGTSAITGMLGIVEGEMHFAFETI